MPERLHPKPTSLKPSVFVVEDEALIAMEISDRLSQIGYEVCGTASRGELALDLICESRPDIVLMDIKLAGAMNGIETADQLRGRYEIPVIYLTAYSDDELLRKAAGTAPYGYILKPFNERELRANIEMALGKHRVEQELRQREAPFLAMVEHSPDSLQVLSAEGRILAINPPGVALHEADSSDQLIGELASEWVAPGSLPVFAEMIAATAGGTPRLFELEVEGRRGSRHQIAANAVSIPNLDDPRAQPQILIISREISHQSQITPRGSIRQLERAETLASGIGHHLSDHLHFILGSAEMTYHELNPVPGDPVADELEKIVDAADAADKLLKNLLDFSGSMKPERELVELDRVIGDAIDEVEQRHPSAPPISRQIDRGCRPVLGNADQLRRALVQLCSNAYQALPDGKGRIELRMTERELSAAERALNPHLLANSYLALSVTDNGRGMDAATRERVFEPFFTTGGGSGTGLGLAALQGVTEAHGGTVMVHSELGEGSTFLILLPAATAGNSPVVRELAFEHTEA